MMVQFKEELHENLMLTVNPREAEPDALLQTKRHKKTNLCGKKKDILRQYCYKCNKGLKRRNITNIVRCRRKRN